MIRFRKTVALFIATWFVALTYLSESHLGHHHDLIPQEAGVCSVNCQIASHHHGFFECIWFHLKTSSRGVTPRQDIPFRFACQGSLNWNLNSGEGFTIPVSIPVRAPPLI